MKRRVRENKIKGVVYALLFVVMLLIDFFSAAPVTGPGPKLSKVNWPQLALPLIK